MRALEYQAMKELLDHNRLIKASRRAFVLALTAAACAASFAPASLRAQIQPQKTLVGHVPAVVAQLQAVQPLAAAQSLDLTIGLPLRNREALTNLLEDLYNPASPRFHQFLTPSQFADQFGPTEQDYAAVVAFAQANGFTISETHSNRVLLNIQAPASAVEKAFGVQLNVYRHPTENRNFYAPNVDPTVPATLPIQDISGLSDYSRPHSMSHSRLLTTVTNALPGSGSGPAGTYMGYDFRTAYAPGVTMTGAGQSVALVQFDGYLASDIALYAAQAGLPGVPLQNVLVDGFNGFPSGNGGEVEVSLDIEMAISMAPYLSSVIVYEGPPTSSTINNVLNKIASDNAARQISCSWGFNGGPNVTTDGILQQMAAQGQSFFTASGDGDAYPAGALDSTTEFGNPARSPYATVVGGTTLTTGPTGSYVSETTWNWGVEYGPADDGIGSSGGISTYYTLPTWQQGVNMSNNGGSFTARNMPDVALTADNVYVIADGGIEYDEGGTSCASPLWAAFMALANQQGATLGKGPIGFANPSLYTIGKGANFAADFHDITTGSNTWSGSPTKFVAMSGYDLCTGWGSPSGQNMLNGLAGGVPRTGVMQMSLTPPSAAAIIASTNQTIVATVSDVSGITNATVVAIIPGVTNLTLTNPAHDNNYSGTFKAPATLGNLPLTVIASNVVGEISVTNNALYNVISLPLNDNFANAAKVPATGGFFLSNNRFATLESQESHHGGVVGVGNSLWWNFVPTVSGPVYVDTTGSAVRTAIGVYTGTSVISNSLAVVASTNNLGATKHVYLKFNAVGGTTYHIAVASAVIGTTGSITLAITPNGQPDTNAPTLEIISPLSGLWVSNKYVSVVGTANDPSPNASGVRLVNLNVNNQWLFTGVGTNNWSSLIALQPGLNNIQVSAVDVQSNVSATANLQLTYVVPNPVNDLFANATPITLSNNAAVVTAFTTNATREFGEPTILGNPGGHSVWWSFQPPADGVLTLNTSNSTFDTLLGVYTGTNVAILTTIAQNDDAYPGVPGGYSYMNQAVRSNQTYFITVDGYNSAFGNARLACSFAPQTVYALTTTASTGGSVQVTTTNLLGGTSTLIGSAGDFAANTYLTLTANPDTYYLFNNWTGTTASTNNPLSFLLTQDMTENANFVTFPFTDGFESGNFSHLPWYFGGDAPWYIQTNTVGFGKFAARSGAIGNSQSSSLLLTTNFLDGVATFDIRVSSESTFDVLTFSIDGNALQQWSGELAWSTFSFPVTNGVHTLQWTYSKDASLASGLDAAFLDDVILPIGTPASTNAPAPGRLSLQRQSDGTFVVNLAGQPDQQYVIQASTNLVDWVSLSTNLAVGGAITVPDSSSLSNRLRFYRAVQLP